MTGIPYYLGITAKDARKTIGKVYQIKKRKYRFVKTMADVEKQTVMIEFIEWYLNHITGQMYYTPHVEICEITSGKIRRTRHHIVPSFSFLAETNDALGVALS